MIDQPNNLLSGALANARRGFRVFPVHTLRGSGRCSCDQDDCDSPGKHPRLRDWIKLATTDEPTIQGWWERRPKSNVGIACGPDSNLLVLDIDPRHHGDETLADLEAKYGRLPDSVESVTGSGGRHIYLSHPAVPVSNSTGRLGPGLDVRTNGGFVVSPPSLHQLGQYHWDMFAHPDSVPLATAPEWLIDLLAVPANEPGSTESPAMVATAIESQSDAENYAEEILERELSALAGAAVGTRNNELNRRAFTLGQLVGANKLDEEKVVDRLAEAAVEIGLSPIEIEPTIESGLRAGKKEPASILIVGKSGTTTTRASGALGRTDRSHSLAAVPDLPSEAHLSDAMEAAAQSARDIWLNPYIKAASRLSPRTSRSLLEATGLFALFTGIARRAYVQAGPKMIFPVQFLLFVGRSTLTGKTTGLLEVLRQLFSSAGLLDLLLPSSFTPQALSADLALQVPKNVREGTQRDQEHWLERHHHAGQRGIIRDELAGLFEDCSKDYNAGLLPLILKLDGAPDYVDGDLTIGRGLTELTNIGISLIGATTPAALRDHAARPYHWANGLFGRIAFIAPDGPPAWAFWPQEVVTFPNEVVEGLKSLYRSLPMPKAQFEYSEAGDGKPRQVVGAMQDGYQAIRVTIDRDAWAAWERYDHALFELARLGDAPERLDPTYGRLPSSAARIALALAVTEWAIVDHDHRSPPILRLGHWAAAQQIAEEWRKSAHTILAGALQGEDAAEAQKSAERLTRVLEENTGRMGRGDALKRLNWTTDTLDSAVAASHGRVRETKTPTRGRPAEWLELVQPEVSKTVGGSEAPSPEPGGDDEDFSAFSAFSTLVPLVEKDQEETPEASNEPHPAIATKVQKALKAPKQDMPLARANEQSAVDAAPVEAREYEL